MLIIFFSHTSEQANNRTRLSLRQELWQNHYVKENKAKGEKKIHNGETIQWPQETADNEGDYQNCHNNAIITPISKEK